jgi:peptidoglycan hydrolase CwlO-like protein
MRYLILFSGMALCVVLSGCGQSKLATENEHLKQQLDSTTKRADKAESDLKAASLEIETQNHNLEELTNRISDFQKDKEKMEKMEKDLEMYRGKVTETISDIKALRSVLDEQNIETSSYAQNYISTKMDVTKLVSIMPESEVHSNILSIMDNFGDIKNLFEDADSQIEQTKETVNDDYHAGVALALATDGDNDYNRAYQKYKYSNILAEKIHDITVKRIEDVAAVETKIDVSLNDLQILIAKSDN